MASDSFQNEIPKSRVNIRYVKDTEGSKESVELPQRVLVIGDFTLKDDDTPIDEREKIAVNKDTYDSVMKSMNLEINTVVKNHMVKDQPDAELAVNLKFQNLKDFRPERIIENVPELNQLMEVRTLLNDLKNRVITNRQFRQELQKILRDKNLTEAFKKQLGEQLGKVTGESGESGGDS